MRTTIGWLVFGLLITSNVVLGLLYITKDSGSTGSASQSPQAEVAGQQTDQFPSMGEDSAVSIDSDEMVEYEAVASNFKLSLSSNYQVVVERDGGDGSLRSTIVRIGRKGAGVNDAISLRSDDYVKIEAYPSDVNGTRDQFVTNDTALQGNEADETATTIDGVEARKFTLNGVGKTIKYYFERDGITYFIESWDVDSGDTLPLLNNVVKGFRFK